jgi:hypothetical protein
MTEEECERDWRNRGYYFGVGTINLEKAVHVDKDELIVAVNGKSCCIRKARRGDVYI